MLTDDWLKYMGSPNVLRKKIDEHRDTFDGDNVRDFIDLYLKMEQSGEENGAFSGKCC